MNDPLFDVSRERILITGAAGTLGLQYAREFLKRGAQVSGIDLKESPELALLEKSHPDQFKFRLGDVTQRKDLEAVLESFGVPTVLINNAAVDSPPSAPIQSNGPFETFPESVWNEVIGANLTGVFLCCQVFGSRMAEQGRGSIINISSIYGMVSPDQSLYEYRRQKGENYFKPAAYSVSKTALHGLTRYLATYWAKRGVRVNTLSLAGVFQEQDPEFVQAYTDRIPVGRMARVDQYNGAVLFLASPASEYMTGSNVVMDGGWTAL